MNIVDHGDLVVVEHDDVDLARYVVVSDAPAFEAPKPYLHPLRTLAGDVVTNFRPHDHRWHKGLQLTCTDLSGHNLWGGHTWVDGTGYTALDNVGRMDPDGPVTVTNDEIAHELVWRSARGEDLIGEHRSLRFELLDDKTWALTWTGELRNLTDESLSFGSPATRGLAGSGYSGLWWRGPRSFTGGQVLLPTGSTPASEARGSDAEWLAFIGAHDGVDRASTLVFEQTMPTERFRTRWFVRSEEFAAVNPSWAFERTFPLEPDETVRIGYRVTIADGALSLEDIEHLRSLR